MKPALLCLTLKASVAFGALTFEKDVRPILKTHCTHCHGEEEKPEGGVDLRLRRFMTDIIKPGKPGESKLLEVVRSGEMPEKGKPLSDAEMKLIERWIAEGAITARPEPETLAPGSLITDEDRAWWAFQPVKRPPVPRVGRDVPRVRNPIDAFIVAKLTEKSIPLAPEADRRALIRRVSLDLTGLLPSPEEVAAFEQDLSPLAYENLIERLLASKSYGERWARHWLDVAGFAESNGASEADSPRPTAWRYRDYVIKAFNEDKPWDEFVQEQLAGDELALANHNDFQAAILEPKRREQLIATGFMTLAPNATADGPPDQKLAANQHIAEQMKVMASSLLGVTVACAQCHDHRYDPITQVDYYRLRALFDPAFFWQGWRSPLRRVYSLYTPEERTKAEQIEAAAKKIEDEARAMGKKFLDEIFEIEILKLPEADRAPYRAARATPTAKQTPEQKALLKKYPSALALYSLNLYDQKKQDLVDAKMAEATKLRATKPVENFITAFTELGGQYLPSHLFYRGDHEQPKQEVQPGELGIIGKDLQFTPTKAKSTGRRLAYAQWLTSGKHPLLARVLVNRFWLHHMGRGIVNTPGDFGKLGELPTHPELLDWLADEFVKSGWKLKTLHRLILLSSTYRQASNNPTAVAADPENRWYGRFKIRRLDAEAFRDSMLAATGTLVHGTGGPSSGIGRDPQGRIITGIDKGTITVNKVDPAGAADFRRSIYVEVRRSKPLTVLDTFDAPAMSPNCEMRNQTTVAPQSLLLMNDTFMLENTRRLADYLATRFPNDRTKQLQYAWELLYARRASQADLDRCLAFLEEQTKSLTQYHHDIQHPKGVVPNPPQEAMASLCQILCGSNRFLYVE